MRMLIGRNFLSVLFISSLLVPALKAGEPDVERLLEELKSDDFDLRRNAAARLKAMGEVALPALKKAQESGHPEVQAMLKKLETSSLVISVYDRDGKPLGGIEVDAEIHARNSSSPNEWIEQRTENIQTQPNGGTVVNNLTPGLLGIQFDWKKMSVSRDSVSWWNWDVQRGPNPLIVTLTKGAEASFAIQNDAGEPIEDGTVSLYSNEGLESELWESELLELQLSLLERPDLSALSATSDKKGIAKFEGINEGSYQSVIRAEGHLPVLGPLVTARSGQALKIPAIKLQAKKAEKLEFVLSRRVEKDEQGASAIEKAKREKANLAIAADANLMKDQSVYYELEYIFEGERAAELQKKQRQLRQTLSKYRPVDALDTDEQGKLTIEDLKPGCYRLTVVHGLGTLWRVDALEIKAGETTNLGLLKNLVGGGVKGKLLDTEGKGLQHMKITAVLESDEDSPYPNNFSIREMYGTQNAQTQKDGTYEFKNLQPGRYALTTHTRKAQPVRIEGVVVEVGKTAEAPEARIPTESGGKNFVTKGVVKGVVKLPDGKPAAYANVQMLSDGLGRWGHNTDGKGHFVFGFNPEQGWTPTAVTAKAPNCKVARVDLSAPEVNFENMVIQLEKQEYGTLRVKVIDEQGNPLEDALVRPRQTNPRYNGFNQMIDQPSITNRNGELRIIGLAVGPREFNVELNGYYTTGTPSAVVLPDGESEVRIQMKRGIVLNGRVEVPPEMQASAIAAVLNGTFMQTAALDAEGRFQFKGLPPGEYSLGALGPALTVLERVKVTLKEGEAPPEAVIKVARPGGVAIGVPVEFAYGQANLVRRDNTNENVAVRSYASAGIDREGRVESFGAAPGEYEVLLHPPESATLLARYQDNETRMAFYAGRVSVKPLKSFDELATLEAVKLQVPERTASVKGNITIVPQPPAEANQNSATLTVRLVGEKADGSVSFTFPSEFKKNAQPLVFGESKKARRKTTAAGAFKFNGLPAGEYKMYVDITTYIYSHAGMRATTEKKTPPVQVVTVKDGETLDLGAVEFTLTAEMLEGVRQGIEADMETESEDQAPVFRP